MTLLDTDWVTSPDSRFRACFTYVGEGWQGDYDSDDPTDSRLLRFDVQTSDPDRVRCDDMDDDGWYWVDSYCTQVEADDITEDEAERLLRIIVNRIDGRDGSLKKELEQLSWITKEWKE